MEKNICFLDIA